MKDAILFLHLENHLIGKAGGYWKLQLAICMSHKVSGKNVNKVLQQ